MSNNLPAKPPVTTLLPPPSPEIVKAQTNTRKNHGLIIGGQFILLSFLMMVFGVGIALFVGVVLLIFLIMIINNSDKDLRRDTNEKLFTARKQWQELEDNWNQAFVPKELNENINLIRAKVGDYQDFQKTSIRQLEKIRAGNRRRVFNQHLRSINITEAEIPGLRPNHIAALESGGVKTAADIEESKLEPLFLVHDDVKRTMLSWREELVRNFDFKPEDELPEADKKRFSRQTDTQRKTIESDIERLLANVHSGAVYVRNKQQQLVSKSEQIAKELVQSESNSQILSSNSTAIVILLLVTFFPPLIVGSFMQASYKPPLPSAGTYSSTGTRPMPDYGTGSGISGNDYKDYVDENISDEEIDKLSESKRTEYANNLYIEAYNLTSDESYNDGNTGNNKDIFEIAEKKMRLAVKLNPEVKNLNQLASVLYQENKYQESLEVLKRAEKLDNKNTITKITIGINYLQLKRYKDAENVFKKVTALDKTSSLGFFNLGLTYKAQQKFKAAAEAFEKAVDINPADADSIYELGLSLKNSGDLEGAKRQYKILFENNKEMAKKLAEDANIFQGGGSGEGTSRGQGSGY